MIVLPIYKEEPYTEDNIRSIDDWEHLFIVDNSEDNFCNKFEQMGAEVRYPKVNIGVSRTWNLGLKEDKDYTFFVSQSVNFRQGFKQIVDELDKIQDQGMAKYGLFTQLGWHCNGISQETVKQIGYFDENFYPSYYEDVDYARRLYIADLHANTPERCFPCITIDAEPITTAAALKSGLRVRFDKLGEYYSQKWNGNHPNEKYIKPFGKYGLKYWEKHTVQELRDKYGC